MVARTYKPRIITMRGFGAGALAEARNIPPAISNAKTTIKLNSVKYQYSDRQARPLKSTYFLKTVAIAVKKPMGPSVSEYESGKWHHGTSVCRLSNDPTR